MTAAVVLSAADNEMLIKGNVVHTYRLALNTTGKLNHFADKVHEE